MNIRTLAAALSFLAFTPFAAARAGEAALTITCAQPRPPSMAAVGKLMGSDNFTATYATRERLMRRAHRACKDPAVATVRFLPAGAATVEPLRLTTR
jgi:hypothetical protein